MNRRESRIDEINAESLPSLCNNNSILCFSIRKLSVRIGAFRLSIVFNIAVVPMTIGAIMATALANSAPHEISFL